MDVVFDEVRGNVVGASPTEPGEKDTGTTPKGANAQRQMREDLMRVSARRARLQAD